MEASSLDTFSIAMTTAPKSLPVLSNIYKIATDIRETTERVAVNKKQCEQLSERIDTLIGFLAQRDLSKCLNDAMQKALNRFETFLLECLDFINTFIEASWFKRIVSNKDYERKFQDLNRELTQYSNDLNFGIGINSMKIDKRHNEKQPTNTESDESDATEKDSPEQIASVTIDSNPHSGINIRENSSKQNDISFPNTINMCQNSQQEYETIFISGLWLYRYYQYNQWFGPFQQQIVFNAMTKRLNGYGADNVGQYVLDGTFSESKGKIKMIQQYQIGTGNLNLNLGHQDAIKLNWNPSREVFEGMAYSLAGGNYVPGALIEMSPA